MSQNPYDPRGKPLLSLKEQHDLTRELIRADKWEDFLICITHMDANDAIDFSQCIYKCVKHDLTEKRDYFLWTAQSMSNIEDKRVKLVSQTIMGVAVPEYYADGHRIQRSDNNGKGNV